MDGAKIWDPLRRKWVAHTPEEEVRQWFVGVLRDHLGVPVHLMNSEVSLRFGAVSWRADILVFDRTGKALLTVECKRPEVELGPETVSQALRYHLSTPVPYLCVTNGTKTFFAVRDGEGFRLMDHAPSYAEMTSI